MFHPPGTKMKKLNHKKLVEFIAIDYKHGLCVWWPYNSLTTLAITWGLPKV